MMHRPLLSLALVLGAAASEPVPVQTGGFGFRGDRNGFFDNCRNLPTTWSEDKNVVWKTVLPSWNHGEMLIVKGKLYCLNEFDMKSHEQIGPSLSCIDVKDGKILWTKVHDHFDLTKEPEKVRTEWIEHRRTISDLEAYREELIKECGGYDAAKSRDQELQKKMSEKHGAFKPIGGTGPSVKFTAPAVRARDDYLRKNNAWFQSWCPPQTTHVGYCMASPVTDGERIYFRTAHNILHCVDLEGSRIWATIFNTTSNGIGDTHLTSPLLIDGRIIVYTGSLRAAGQDPKKDPAARSVVAFEAKTGKELWSVTAQWGDMITCALGSPLPMDLGGTTAIYTALGMVIRVSDGKVLARGIGHEHDANNAIVARGNIIVGVNGGGDSGWSPEKDPSAKDRVAVAHGTGMWAVKVTMDGTDQAKVEELWHSGNGGRQDGLTYANGILFARADCDKTRKENASKHRGGVLAMEAETGKVLGHQPKIGTGFWKPVVAGGYFFNGDPKKGRFDIATADATMAPVGGGFLFGKLQDNPDPKADEYWGRFYRTLGFVPSGNRIFVRGWNILYCLGDPQQAANLSPANQ